MLCSVVKHLGSGRELKKWRKTLDYVSCFPYTFFSCSTASCVLSTEQNSAQSRLLYLLIKILLAKTIKHAFSMFYTLTKHGFLTNQSARGPIYILKLNETLIDSCGVFSSS